MTISMEADFTFSLFDINSDGLLSKSDFRELTIFYTGHIPTVFSLTKIWQGIEGDKEGFITKNDYCRWLKRRSPHSMNESLSQTMGGRHPNLNCGNTFKKILGDTINGKELSVFDVFNRWKSPGRPGSSRRTTRITESSPLEWH